MTGALVGRKIRVQGCANPLHAGVSGTVEDETRNMLMIRSEDGKTRSVPKASTVFLVEKGGEWVRAEGGRIIGKIQDRTKKR